MASLRVSRRRGVQTPALLMLAGLVSCASPNPTSQPTAAEVVEILMEQLPSEICGSSLLAECLALTEESCEASITPMVALCGQERLRSAAQEDPFESEIAAEWADAISHCAGQALMVTQLPHLSIASECLALYH